MLTANTTQSLSNQISIEDNDIKSLIKNILKTDVIELRYLSYAFTNKTILLYLKDAPFKAVIKICIADDRINKIKSEVELIQKLEKEDIPVPKVLYSDFSKTNFPYAFAIYSFLEGENLVDSIVHIKNKSKLGEELARISLVIHKIELENPKFSLGSEELSESWVSLINEKITDGLSKLKENNYHKLAEIEKYINESSSLIIEPEKYNLIHRDLQPQNLHWDNKREELVGVFDFESAMSGDFLFEFNFFERQLFKSYPEIAEPFYKTYEKGRILSPNYKEIIRFYEVIRDLYFYVRDIKYGEMDRAGNDIESIERIIFKDWNIG